MSNACNCSDLVERLRRQVTQLVDVLDRMEPDVPFEQRTTDEEWDAVVFDARNLLQEVANR